MSCYHGIGCRLPPSRAVKPHKLRYQWLGYGTNLSSAPERPNFSSDGESRHSISRNMLHKWTSGQFFQQGIRFLEIEDLEAFGKPVVNRYQQIAGGVILALILPKSREVGGGA